MNEKEYYQYNKWLYKDNHYGKNYTGPFVHPLVRDFKDVEEKYKDRSLIETLRMKVEKHKERPFIGRRLMLPDGTFEKKYTFLKFKEVLELVDNTAKNLHVRKNDIITEDDYQGIHFNLVGIFAKNCTEWVVFDYACQMDSITTVTLYSTLGAESFKFICDQTNIKCICVSPDLIDNLLQWKKELNITSLKYVILFDYTNKPKEEDIKKIEEAQLNIIYFTDLLKENNDVNINELSISKPDTILTICYTSGTTGKPKGVMITQRNMISIVEMVIIDSAVPVNEEKGGGTHVSFLPLAHIMERMVINGFMCIGGNFGFLSGSLKDIFIDLELLGPTLLFTVPRVLQRLREGIYEQFKKLTGFQKRLVNIALAIKRDNFRKYGIIHHPVFDKLIFNKVRSKFGPGLKCILCASAPMSPELSEDIKILTSTPIVEGWGMTELSGSSFASNYNDLTNITAGGGIRTTLLKLQDVPELEYTKDSIVDGKHCPSGEICIKGPNVCIGYYKNPEETKKLFDEDGFLHTGDIGRLYPHFGNGVRIVDRVKEIFKLSQGEYIIPSKLESIYLDCNLVSQMLIYGNPTKNNIISIVTLNKKKCAEFLGVKDIDTEKEKDNVQLKNEIINRFQDLAQKAKLNHLEYVKDIVISPYEFSIENGCLTPNLKLVRKKIEKLFIKEIENSYSKIEGN